MRTEVMGNGGERRKHGNRGTLSIFSSLDRPYIGGEER